MGKTPKPGFKLKVEDGECEAVDRPYSIGYVISVIKSKLHTTAVKLHVAEKYLIYLR